MNLKSDFDTYNIDEHTFTVNVPFLGEFVSQIARMTYDGEEMDDGECFEMSNDDAVDTAQRLDSRGKGIGIERGGSIGPRVWPKYKIYNSPK